MKNGKDMIDPVSSGTDLILKDHKPIRLSRPGVVVHVVAGRVWIVSNGVDHILEKGECFTAPGPRASVRLQNIGRFPATVRFQTGGCEEM